MKRAYCQNGGSKTTRISSHTQSQKLVDHHYQICENSTSSQSYFFFFWFLPVLDVGNNLHSSVSLNGSVVPLQVQFLRFPNQKTLLLPTPILLGSPSLQTATVYFLSVVPLVICSIIPLSNTPLSHYASRTILDHVDVSD